LLPSKRNTEGWPGHHPRHHPRHHRPGRRNTGGWPGGWARLVSRRRNTWGWPGHHPRPRHNRPRRRNAGGWAGGWAWLVPSRRNTGGWPGHHPRHHFTHQRPRRRNTGGWPGSNTGRGPGRRAWRRARRPPAGIGRQSAPLGTSGQRRRAGRRAGGQFRAVNDRRPRCEWSGDSGGRCARRGAGGGSRGETALVERRGGWRAGGWARGHARGRARGHLAREGGGRRRA